MAAINPPGYLHNVTTHTAQTDRLNKDLLLVPDVVGSLRPRGGIRIPGDLALTAAAGMNVSLAAGMCAVPQGQSNLGGSYACANDGPMTIAIAAANASLGRNDLIVARVRDSFYTGTQGILSFEPITGTAASTPSDPALPTDSSFLSLWRVFVPAGATSAAQFTLTQLAGYVQIVGAATPVTAADNVAGLYVGQHRDHPTNGDQRWNGTAWGEPNPEQVLTVNYGGSYADGSAPYSPLRLYKRGTRCLLLGSFTYTGGGSAGTGTFVQLGTLPAGVVPTGVSIDNCATNNGSAWGLGLSYVDAAGVLMYNPITLSLPGASAGRVVFDHEFRSTT